MKRRAMQEEDLDTGEAFDWDDSKLVIFADRAGMTGDELHQILLKKYHLQMEMVSGYYVLGMTSLMDEDEGLERLAGALHDGPQDMSALLTSVRPQHRRITHHLFHL